MKIVDAIKLIEAQSYLMRTVFSRPISEYGLKTLDAVLLDRNNYKMDIMQCKNCGFITSELLFEKGCKNCGGKDLDSNINVNNTLI